MLPQDVIDAIAQALAAQLQTDVPATLEGVIAALTQAQAQATSTEGQAMESAAPQMAAPLAQFKAFLGLPANATLDQVQAASDELKATFENALASTSVIARGAAAVSTAKTALKHNRKGWDMSGNTDDDEPRQQVNKNTGEVMQAKSATYGAMYQVNKTPKPGIVSMLRDINPANKSMKAISYSTGASGGYLLNHETANDYLPALRAAIPLFDMGVTDYSMEGQESLTIPKDTTTETTAYWVGEGTEVPDSDELTGYVTLFPRPLAARVIVPNKYLSNTTMDYEARIREKITYKLNAAIMVAALRGTGGTSGSNTGAEPQGLLYASGVTQTSLSTDGRKPNLDDLVKALGRMQDDNVELDNTTAWLMSPRSKRTLFSVTDSTGQPLLRENWSSTERQPLLGYPVYDSTLLTNTVTQGTNTDTSRIYAGVWKHMAIGMSNQFEFMVNPYARMSRLQTEIIVYTYVDVAVLYPEAFEILLGARA